jgi:hypothetical protein
MESSYSESELTLAEHKFVDFMQHGDDFFKIEIWRLAISWYKKAYELNIESKRVKQKIAGCDRLVIYELKIIRILVVIAAIAVTVYFILR